MWIKDVFLLLHKLFIKAKVGYKIIQSLSYNCKTLKKDLDPQ